MSLFHRTLKHVAQSLPLGTDGVKKAPMAAVDSMVKKRLGVQDLPLSELPLLLSGGLLNSSTTYISHISKDGNVALSSVLYYIVLTRPSPL